MVMSVASMAAALAGVVPLHVAVARGLELIQSLSRRGTPATSVRFEVPVVLSVDDTIVRRIHDDLLKDASQVADRIFCAVDVVIAAPRHRISDTDARRMAARLRERGAVLIHIGDRWPVGADVQLDIASGEWEGLGDGHGVLRSRRLDIQGGGRGSASRPRQLALLVPGPGGAVASLAA